MTKVSLRAYNREIEGLIEQGHQLDEAVAHCRHLLRTYPKHLETYRLLGKAYLEGKRYDQAVDIFQRVLVAAPEDFVSHVGMSIIADDQGKLDEAIWHMERAFEVQPSNAAIQAELQRLFGRRDGVEPPKIRLTRGALAHMYVQGELYTQAISEIRAVLSHDQNRTDMQVLLARAYFRNAQKAEAADVCSALLAISPYCFDANRLMAEILEGGQTADAAREHRRRVCELDPYAELAQGSVFSTDTVADGAVTLERLDYTGQPSEAASALGIGLGATLGAPDEAASPPTWLTSVSEVKTGLGSEEEGYSGVPEFMREAGWKEVDSGPSQVAGLGEADSSLEGNAVPGDLPEWVRALAPSDEPGREPPAQEPSGQAPSWLLDTDDTAQAALASSEETGEDDEAPDWLSGLATASEEPTHMPATPKQAEGTAEPTLKDIGGLGTTPKEQDDALAWLEGLAEKHGAKPEELLTAPGARPSMPPEWVDRAKQLGVPSGQDWEPIVEAPGGSGEGTPDGMATAAPPSGQKPFDWLTGLSDRDAFAEMGEQTEADQAPIMEESEAAVWPRPERGPSVGDVPHWLGTDQAPPANTGSAAAREPSGEYESAVALPDWLAGLDSEKPVSPAAATGETSSEHLPDWLQTGQVIKPEDAAMRASQWHPAETSRASAVSDTGAGRLPEITGAEIDARFLEAARGSQPEHETQLPGPLPARTRAVSAALKVGVPSLGGAQAELGRGNIAVALDLYGKLIRKGRSMEEIIRDLRDALYRYPVEVPIWQALGDAYMRANRLQEALDAYTKAEELLR